MNNVKHVLMTTVVSSALLSLAATDANQTDRAVDMGSAQAGTTNLMGATANGTNGAAWKLTNTNAWKRSADEAATAAGRAADTTRDTLNKAGETTKDAVKDAGRAIERTGERMQ